MNKSLEERIGIDDPTIILHEDRLFALEEICRRLDNSIGILQEDVFKLQEEKKATYLILGSQVRGLDFRIKEIKTLREELEMKIQKMDAKSHREFIAKHGLEKATEERRKILMKRHKSVFLNEEENDE